MAEQINITKRTIEALPIPEEGRVEYRDLKDRYLRIVVSPGGRYSWRYVRKVAGYTHRYTIGTYPETSPDEARRESKRVGAEYDAGNDPQKKKEKLRNMLSWSDLFSWYIETHAKPHKRTWEYDVKMNELYCKPWQNKPYADITVDLVTRWHKKIGADRGHHQADRVLALVKTVFSKGIEAEAIEGRNPALTVKKFFSSSKQYSRDRYLSGEEIGRLVKALAEYHDQDASDFFMVSLFTGARRGNVQTMRWDHMDRSDPLKPQWVIPGEESKNGEPMKVVLVEPVISILNRRYETIAKTDKTPKAGSLVSMKGRAKTDKTDKTLSRSDYVFPAKQSNSTTPHLVEPKRAWATICKNAGLENVRIHDLRRTLGSWQAIMGSSLQIIGRSLGHKSLQSTEVYARMDIDPVRASVTGAAVAMLAAANKEGGDE